MISNNSINFSGPLSSAIYSPLQRMLFTQYMTVFLTEESLLGFYMHQVAFCHSLSKCLKKIVYSKSKLKQNKTKMEVMCFTFSELTVY